VTRPLQRLYEQIAHAPAVIGGAVGNQTHRRLATARRHCRPHVGPGAIRPVGAKPALEEDRLEQLHDRPLAAQVGVAPRHASTFCQHRTHPVLVTDVEPTGEGHLTIDDEDLAVVPGPRRPARIDPTERVEHGDIGTRLAQRLELP
jgi:hypothetical protein